MMDHCYDYAVAAKTAGRPVVAAMCEFTPWELILAAGAVPVCMCGGSAGTIPAAEELLPANLCPLIKSTFGYHVTRSNPFLEMADLVVAETTCDGKKKMYELMAQSRPMHILELPQKQDDADSFRHWLGEVHRFKEQLERRFKVDITPQRLRDAVGVMNRERSLRRSLAALMKADCPPLSGRQLLDLRSGIPGMPGAAEQMDLALQTLSRRGGDERLGGRVRVLLTGVPTVRGAERVVELIEDRGGLIVCTENCTGLKPILDDVETDDPDLIHAVARKYFNLPCSVMTRNDRRLESLKRLTGEYRPACVIDLIWQACLTYDVESASVRRLVTGPLGLPYLRIETDYSPSDSARLAVRIEALFETVRAARGG
jgi:benzoyl-CoA reductase/2-hydroxyglutaryl-CoA dehydratase subunit BcrC/BadD/HgdB